MAELLRLADVAMIALRKRAAADMPPVGKSVLRDGDRIVAIGPDEWLVIGRDSDAAALLARFADRGGVQIDVSGNRACYRLAEADALDLLTAGCALDLEALRPGDAVTTLLARAQVILIAEADGFLVLPRRSFARYLEDWASVA